MLAGKASGTKRRYSRDLQSSDGGLRNSPISSPPNDHYPYPKLIITEFPQGGSPPLLFWGKPRWRINTPSPFRCVISRKIRQYGQMHPSFEGKSRGDPCLHRPKGFGAPVVGHAAAEIRRTGGNLPPRLHGRLSNAIIPGRANAAIAPVAGAQSRSTRILWRHHDGHLSSRLLSCSRCYHSWGDAALAGAMCRQREEEGPPQHLVPHDRRAALGNPSVRPVIPTSRRPIWIDWAPREPDSTTRPA